MLCKTLILSPAGLIAARDVVASRRATRPWLPSGASSPKCRSTTSRGTALHERRS